MANTAIIVIICVALFESLIIIVGNIFTIFVFWKHRNRLKRTSLLLINLAVADLLVGLTEPISAGINKLPRELDERSSENEEISYTLETVFYFASVFFLVLISMERAYALIWPLRHRVASTKGYIYSVVIVWLAAISTGVLYLLTVYGVFNQVHWMVVACAMIISSLTMICVSYLSIRKRLNCRVPALDAGRHNRQMEPEQKAKLSRTLFVVIAASLVCWLPGMVLLCIQILCPECNSLQLFYALNMLRLANSIVNPIIYSFRIPMFRQTIKRIKLRRPST